MIKENLEKIFNEIKSKDVQLIAVTKLHDVEEINNAIDLGITDIGENKVQEILNKYDRVKPVNWHLIGHLQTNKVKYIIDKVKLIHSVDSIKLANEIDKRANEINKVQDILIQVNIANEESKFGIKKEELVPLLKNIKENCKNIKVVGLMMIAPFSEDPENVRIYFKEMKELYDTTKDENFKYLSMGMSNDYSVAIEEGSNLIRIGTGIFGARDYSKKEGN